MRWMLPGLALLLVLATVSSSLLTAPRAVSTPFAVHASAVNLNVTETDPTGDVFRLWTSNGTHVTDANGFWLTASTPREVDLTRLTSTDAGVTVDIALRVRSAIASRVNVSYEIRIYPQADNGTRYRVDFENGVASLRPDTPGAASVNLTGNTTIAPGSTLNFAVNKTLLGGASAIGAWSVDASSREIVGNITYADSVWQVPGDPLSAPAFIQGRVTDAASTAGLSGVTVSAGAMGYSTSTNETGFYSLPAAPGNFTLTFSATGYSSLSKNVTVQSEQTQTVNAQLSQAPSILASPSLWAGLIVALVAVGAVAFLISRRRRAQTPPPEPPQPEPPQP